MRTGISSNYAGEGVVGGNGMPDFQETVWSPLLTEKWCGFTSTGGRGVLIPSSGLHLQSVFKILAWERVLEQISYLI